MAKRSLIILLFLVAFTLAWKYEIHESSVEAAYYSMPVSLKEKLSLESMKLGSIAPDAKFKDFRNHKYPYSLNKSSYYLGLAKDSYLKGDFKNASYFFGVAAHYILDSFDAPHYVTKEPYSMHSKFESVSFDSETMCYDYGNVSLDYRNEGKKDWDEWLATRNSSIQKKELNKAMEAVYSSAIKAFDYSCSSGRTSFIENRGSGYLIAFLAILAAMIFVFRFF
ncbi:zinc dependent phospholipase C family protein [Candidatus Woesearchaeota archaeon]|nr:zinc dependent phospholipase C family protein [Candidatus Woesearchaeota archaeon]